MKKTKVLVMALAVVLCLSFAATANAATLSPVGGATSVVSDVPAGVHIVTQAITSTQESAINAAISQNNIAGKLVIMQDISLKKADGSAYTPGSPVTFKMFYSVHSYDKATVVHIKQDGSVELIPATCFDGYVEFPMSSFSPVGLVVQAGTAPSGSDSSSTAATTSVSPKTDDTGSMPAVWYIVAAAAAAVIVGVVVYTLKTKKENLS